MGKGKEVHELPVHRLEEKFGPGEDRALKSIYDEDYKKNHKKCPSLTADYVGNRAECNAYVDVFSKKDEWRQLMGKVVAYSYEITRVHSDKEVWLVSVDMLVDKGWADWYRRVIQLAAEMLPVGLKSRVRYKDFDPATGEFRDIPLNIPIA